MFSKKIMTLSFVFLFCNIILAHAQEPLTLSEPTIRPLGLGGSAREVLELQRRLSEEQVRREQLEKTLQKTLEEPALREELELMEEESEIERYFSPLISLETPDVKLTQFGYDLFQSTTMDFIPVAAPVGPNYVVGSGDELFIYIWGSVEDTFGVDVGRNGDIVLPKLGVLYISGMTLGNLKEYLLRQFSKYYMGFNLDICLGRLRSIQVFIVGDVENPGTYTLSPLATSFHALFKCGGPTKKGTLRDIRIMRQNKVAANIDFYQFVLKGDKSQDMRLEDGDTIFVPPIGQVVAITGKVKRPGIYELKGESTAIELIEMAGGTMLGGTEAEIEIERILIANGDENPANGDENPANISSNSKLREGDLVRILPEMVTISGEVRNPGKYIIKKGERLSSVLEKAGGFTEHAYPKGAFFTRESIRVVEEERLKEHVDILEREILMGSMEASEVATPEEAKMLKESLTIKKELLEKLKTAKAIGRVVVKLDTLDKFKDSPYDIELEEGDLLYVPPRPGTITVMGEVHNPTSIIYSRGKDVNYYLDKVGGATQKADKKGTYVIKADGSVIGKNQKGKLGTSWNSRTKRFILGRSSSDLEAGDTILVPPKLERAAIKRDLMDWSTVIYHGALGAGVALAAF